MSSILKSNAQPAASSISKPNSCAHGSDMHPNSK